MKHYQQQRLHEAGQSTQRPTTTTTTTTHPRPTTTTTTTATVSTQKSPSKARPVGKRDMELDGIEINNPSDISL